MIAETFSHAYFITRDYQKSRQSSLQKVYGVGAAAVHDYVASAGNTGWRACGVLLGPSGSSKSTLLNIIVPRWGKLGVLW
ncbi:MAG TPA: hypothetical protein PKG49_00450 [Nitrosomonas mobilis]|nr:hypothetical protein [Nitrosomonas mobilis]